MKIWNTGRRPLGIEAGRAVRTAPDPLSAVGVVRIVIDFRARTKAKRPRLHRLIYQSLDCLATGTPAGRA
jgi:hypothetical protein